MMLNRNILYITFSLKIKNNIIEIHQNTHISCHIIYKLVLLLPLQIYTNKLILLYKLIISSTTSKKIISNTTLKEKDFLNYSTEKSIVVLFTQGIHTNKCFFQ